MTDIGKTRIQHDTLDPERVAALHATLNYPGPPPGYGDHLPPFWHYIHFWESLPPAALGRDGHPKTGEFIPDLGLPRRMWAGGSLVFHRPLIIGIATRKHTKITDIARKSGRTGELAIISLRHEFSQDGQLCMTEDQSLLYRAKADPHTAPSVPPTAPTNETICRQRRFSTTDLFRYSALTFNGHRIHYDRDYATKVEGYAGLIVHGPLLAQMLIEIAEGVLGPLKSFEFRATAPLFDFETGSFCAAPSESGIELWARAPDGRMCMTARAA